MTYRMSLKHSNQKSVVFFLAKESVNLLFTRHNLADILHMQEFNKMSKKVMMKKYLQQWGHKYNKINLSKRRSRNFSSIRLFKKNAAFYSLSGRVLYCGIFGGRRTTKYHLPSRRVRTCNFTIGCAIWHHWTTSMHPVHCTMRQSYMPRPTNLKNNHYQFIT